MEQSKTTDPARHLLSEHNVLKFGEPQQFWLETEYKLFEGQTARGSCLAVKAGVPRGDPGDAGWTPSKAVRMLLGHKSLCTQCPSRIWFCVSEGSYVLCQQECSLPLLSGSNTELFIFPDALEMRQQDWDLDNEWGLFSWSVDFIYW